MEKLFSVYEKSGVPTQRLSIYQVINLKEFKHVLEVRL